MSCSANRNKIARTAPAGGIPALMGQVTGVIGAIAQEVAALPRAEQALIARVGGALGVAAGLALWSREARHVVSHRLEARAVTELIRRTVQVAAQGAAAPSPELGHSLLNQAAAKLGVIAESLPKMGLTADVQRQLAGQCRLALTWIDHVRDSARDSDPVQDFVTATALSNGFGMAGFRPQVKPPSTIRAALGGVAAATLVSGTLAAVAVSRRRRVRVRKPAARRAVKPRKTALSVKPAVKSRPETTREPAA